MRISVAVTNHNYGAYVAAALDSVIAQSHAAAEIVVVDDGSTDDSRQVLRRYADRVRVIEQENVGVAAATSVALAACTGDVLCLLDADDLMLPGRLERLSTIHEEHPDVEWVATQLEHIDRASGRQLDTAPRYEGHIVGVTDVRERARRGEFGLPVLAPAASGLSFRRELLRRIGPIPPLVHTQDNYLRFAAYALAVGYADPETLVRQGMHDANLYTRSSGRARDVIRAENAVATARGFEKVGSELFALGDGLIGATLWLSRGGRRLRPKYRAALASHVRGLTGPRLGRVGRASLRTAAVAGRDRLRAVR